MNIDAIELYVYVHWQSTLFCIALAGILKVNATFKKFVPHLKMEYVDNLWQSLYFMWVYSQKGEFIMASRTRVAMGQERVAIYLPYSYSIQSVIIIIPYFYVFHKLRCVLQVHNTYYILINVVPLHYKTHGRFHWAKFSKFSWFLRTISGVFCAKY